jgi:succinate dehydrogenase / fumarate reductase, membrane anchor subunit
MATASKPVRHRRGDRKRGAGNFEVHAWFFMRLSGLALVVLALTHWTIMHFINRLSVQSHEWIVARYQNVFWPTFDMVLLIFAMVHGTNGARYIIDDYIRNDALRVLALGILYVAAFAFLVLGAIVIAMIPFSGGTH